MVFNDYAIYYDLLYKDKNYIKESEYVDSLIKRNAVNAIHILELGCGTGAHAEHLARMGYTVHGVDMSKEMLARAEIRKAGLPADVAARLSFSLGDVRSVRTEKIYNVVISLFHVMSYQSTNDDLAAAFETARTHLTSGGLFLYDFWYGPAVLTQYPDTRVKRLENSEIKVTRIAEPELFVNENLVDVNYDVFIENKKDGGIEQLNEKHRMRYFFLPELEWYRRTFWKELVSEEWLSGDSLNKNSWSGFQLLSRI
ncbi:MAG: class I SAM-dependent methyltransferase [Bacteroidetes bacterium]|nr:class I SAM-dependent methyltransferase [Bacteroidota bacterium]